MTCYALLNNFDDIWVGTIFKTIKIQWYSWMSSKVFQCSSMFIAWDFKFALRLSSQPRMSSDVPQCPRMFLNVQGMRSLSRDPACRLPALCSNRCTLCSLHYCILHSAQCTVHSSQYTVHSAHHTIHCTHSTFYTTHTPHFILHTPQCTLHILHCTLHSVNSTLYTAHSTIHIIRSTSYTSYHSTLWVAQCRQCTL